MADAENMRTEDLRLDLMQEVLRLLDETLSLSGRSASFKADTALLGSVPELDSMAVVSVITGLEDRFGIVIDDDDIDGDTFATVGSLVEFVKGKVGS
ncbi:MAG TPA: phosphopantetheine-binding protein [Burkholderiaceae bacterium]|nr:phosphopantetheine-binding protein [Burkholderiaceae bacterium]